MIRKANYLIIAKTDLDNNLHHKLLEKADIYTLRPSTKVKKIKRQIGGVQIQLKSYTVSEKYYLMIDTGATFIYILYSHAN